MDLFTVFAKIVLDDSEFRQGINKAVDFMEDFGRVVCECNDALNEVADTVGGAMSGISEASEKVSERADSFITHLRAILSYLKEIDGLVGGMLSGGLFERLKALGPKKGAIAAGIAAVAAALVYLATRSEEIQRRLSYAYDKIYEGTKAVCRGIERFVDEHGEQLYRIYNLTWEAIDIVLGVALDGLTQVLKKRFAPFVLAWRAVTGFLAERWGYIMEFINRVFDRALDIIEGILEVFTGRFHGDLERVWQGMERITGRSMDEIAEITGRIVEIGSNIVRGLFMGIFGRRAWLADRLREFFDSDVLGVVRRFLGINSPSRIFADQVGKMIAQGVACGIEEEAHVAEKAAVQMAEDMLNPKVEVFADKFAKIKHIVTTVLESMSRMAYQIVRAMTALLDARLTVDGRQIGRNFFRALGDGLIDEEGRLMAEALRVSDALKDIFRSREAEALGLGANMAMAMEMSSMGNRNNEFHLNFYGVKEKQTAYEVYRAAQRIAWGMKE